MTLTADQIKQIQGIIREHFSALTFLTVGLEPTEFDLQDLKARGVIDATVPLDLIKDGFVYGILAAMDSASASSSIAEVLRRADELALSGQERDAVKWLSESAGSYCKGLGNRFDAAASRIFYDAERESKVMGIIRDKLAAGAAARQTRSQMITQLREATEDLHRDWQRVVNTELHQARTFGTVSHITKTFGPKASVIVRPCPDACDLCKEAYFDHDGNPRVFPLREIAARNNVGRAAAEIRSAPGLPPVHPHCACQVQHFDPELHEFDELGRVVFRAH